MKANFFRDLSPEEVTEFKEWARLEYTPGEEIRNIWHPVVQHECRVINARYATARRMANKRPVSIGETVLVNDTPVIITAEEDIRGVPHWGFSYRDYDEDCNLIGWVPKTCITA